MEKILNLFKECGLRVTPQRVEVYRILLDKKGHLTAEEIYENIKIKLPAISLATIYAVLDILRQKKLIQEIRIKFDKSCYEARVDVHHHFFCRSCDSIFNIELKPCATLECKEIDGHRIEELQGYFYGVCKKCLKQ